MVVDRMARAHGGDPIDLWMELTERVEAMGGTELEFVCQDEAASEVCRLLWTSDRRPLQDGAVWQFKYSVPGNDGSQATLSSHGHLHDRLRGQRLVDLFRLFDTFCRSWTSTLSTLGAVESSPSILSFPAAQTPIEPAATRLAEPAARSHAA